MTTTTEVMEHIAASPAGKRALAEIEAERLERRRTLAGELAVLEAEFRDAFPSLDTATEKAQGAVRAAEAKVMAARTKYAEADSARRSATNRYDTARGRICSQLVETALPMLDAFQRELREIADSVRGDLRTSEGGRHWLTGVRQPGTSNYETIVQTLEAIREAREASELLRLEAIDDAAVEQRLAGLRKVIQDAWARG